MLDDDKVCFEPGKEIKVKGGYALPHPGHYTTIYQRDPSFYPGPERAQYFKREDPYVQCFEKTKNGMDKTDKTKLKIVTSRTWHGDKRITAVEFTCEYK